MDAAMQKPDFIGRYCIERQLGAGGFCVVWLGYDGELEAPVAIKVMAERWAQQQETLARFRDEAKFLRKVDSLRAVKIYDIGTTPDGRPFYVMEYADRGSLKDLLQRARYKLPTQEALRTAAEAALAVQDLHDAGLLHRDIKPSNFLISSRLTEPDRVLAADLGLAKRLEFASGITLPVGSPGYMAPEQSTPRDGLDQRADVYGLGVLAYELLAGEIPPSEDAGAALKAARGRWLPVPASRG